jgi:hypothetical protein
MYLVGARRLDLEVPHRHRRLERAAGLGGRIGRRRLERRRLRAGIRRGRWRGGTGNQGHLLLPALARDGQVDLLAFRKGPQQDRQVTRLEHLAALGVGDEVARLQAGLGGRPALHDGRDQGTRPSGWIADPEAPLTGPGGGTDEEDRQPSPFEPSVPWHMHALRCPHHPYLLQSIR